MQEQEANNKSKQTTSFLKKIIAGLFERCTQRKSAYKDEAVNIEAGRKGALQDNICLTDPQRAAIFLVCIPTEIQSQIFNELSEETVNNIAYHVSTLPEVPLEKRKLIVQEFTETFNLPENLIDRPEETSKSLTIDDFKVIGRLIESLFLVEKAIKRSPNIIKAIKESPPVNLSEPLQENANRLPYEGMEKIQGSPPVRHDEHDVIQECDRDIAAAMVFTGQGAFPRWYKERVLSYLEIDEINAIGRGIGILNSSRDLAKNSLWEKIEKHFTGDWWEERDVAELIRNVLKTGLSQQIEYRWSFKLSTLLLSLSAENYDRIFREISLKIPPHCRVDLMTEISALLFRLNQKTRMMIVKDFFDFYHGTSDRTWLRCDRLSMGNYLKKLYRSDPDSFKTALKRIILKGKESLLQLEMLSMDRPDIAADLFLRYCLSGKKWRSLEEEKKVQWIIHLTDEKGLGCTGLKLPGFTPRLESFIFNEFLGLYYSTRPNLIRSFVINDN